MDSSDKLKRLILELPWLSKNKSVSIDEFCNTFSISREQAIKDLTLLTFVGPSQFGGDLVDIQISDETITVVDDQKHENSIQFTPEELMVLMSSLNLLLKSDQTNLTLKSLFNKISDLLYENNEELEINYDEITNIVSKSLEEKQLILIDYIDGRNNVKEKIKIKPISIEDYGNFKYLKGVDLQFNTSKSYRFDRILAVATTDKKLEHYSDTFAEKTNMELRMIVPFWKENILDKMNIDNIKINNSYLEFDMPFYDLSYVKTLIYTLGKDIQLNVDSVIKKNILAQISQDIDRLL